MKKKIERKPKQSKAPAPAAAAKAVGASVQKPASLHIVGESPMVEQYAEICAAKGYAVIVSFNGAEHKRPSSISGNIRMSDTVSAKASVALELTNLDPAAKRKNLEMLDKILPETVPILSSSVTMTATEQSQWVQKRHRLVGIAALPTFIEKPLVEVAPTIYSPRETLEAVSRFYHSIGKEIEVVQDRVGMVMPRIICQIINEAAFAVMEEIAPPQDIDQALKLGVRFPFGPIEWSEKIGLKQVYGVLAALYDDLHEERYRISPLLKQMALGGEWWKQPSGQ